MKPFVILSPGIFFCLNLLLPASNRFQPCLPPGIKSTDVVSAQFFKSSKTVKKITVVQRLTELKAHCKKARLVDVTGREIYFYRLKGCWGNPPGDYQEILQQQANELEKLKRHYTVIEMTCNPDGTQLH